MTTKQLNRRQVRWAKSLSQFDFVISYQKGKHHGKLDSLTRRSQDLPSSPDDKHLVHQKQTLLDLNNVDPNILQKINDNSHIIHSKPYNLSLINLTSEPTDHKLARLFTHGYKSNNNGKKLDK